MIELDISLDPGNECGASIWAGLQMIGCGLVNRGDDPGGINPLAWLRHYNRERFRNLVIEIPRISKQTKDPASIIKLAITAGRMIERFPHANLVYTFVDGWKGSVEKELMCSRVLEILDPPERARLPALAKTYLHNVIDSIGVGCRANGRMVRGGRARRSGR